MQEKPTAALEQELSACADLRAYLKTNTGALCAPGLPALLQQLMQSRGLSRAELLRRSGLNAVYGYQILSGKRHPGRESLLCLCFGLGLDAEQTQKLLLHAGCAQLYIKKPRESIIFYALNATLPLLSCNQLLYEHGEAILGWA